MGPYLAELAPDKKLQTFIDLRLGQHSNQLATATHTASPSNPGFPLATGSIDTKNSASNSCFCLDGVGITRLLEVGFLPKFLGRLGCFLVRPALILVDILDFLMPHFWGARSRE